MSRIRICFILAGVLALSACALPGGKPGPKAGPRPVTPDRVAVVPPAPQPDPVEKAEAPPARPRTPVTVRRLPPKPPYQPHFPRVRVGDLSAMSAADALSVFGKPARAHQDADSVAWTYENAGCRLRLVFHFSVARNALQASDYEVSPATTPSSICLHVLARPVPRLAARPGA